MAFAYFIAHAKLSLFPVVNGGELAVLYCFVFLVFAAIGGGRYSLDHLRGQRLPPENDLAPELTPERIREIGTTITKVK